MDYFIVDSTSEFVETIAVFLDKEEAYDSLNHFCSVYPLGWIEVMTEDELIIAKGG
jgi:hypothetical protein